MQRRSFLTLLGGAAAAWPMAARAQPLGVPVVGFLGSTAPGPYASVVGAFRRGLAETGFIESQNVRIEFRWAENRYDQLPALVADLIRIQSAVLVAGGAVNAVLAAKEATSTIPIVFLVGSDPVQMGLVTALNRPGGNVTGVTTIATELLAKRLELLRELIPKAGAIGVIVNPTNPNTEPSVREMQSLAEVSGWVLHVVSARNQSELATAFTTLKQKKADGFFSATDAFLSSQFDQIAALAAEHALPGIGTNRDFVEAGGVISCGASRLDGYRQVGIYAGRILKGEKPADLPVMRPTKFETVLNLKAARALGLDVPTATLLRADEVIE